MKLTEGNSEYNEGTDWERRYREGNAPWDHGKSVPAVAEALEFFGKPRKILVPGCGFGHDVAALSRGGHEVEGWDLAPTAVAQARELYAEAGVRFDVRNLLTAEVEEDAFDGVFEHTFLCAIGPDHWRTASDQFARLLKPGGLFFAILFTEMEEENPPPWGISADQVRELFSPTFEILGTRRPREAFSRRIGEETLWEMRLRG
ncbi:class I SAM-dependent methyltransferase [Puniceicoccus vermicola]|uniref:Methyltransferase domain-containing protein n=1 Tax=Puniceicoccus vermicola TaxID=388746 RepID=A0A7X1E6Z0_9BACT|nr:methyltransferase domain-containing protein [Puniceicoccus vermicola]MBC2603142.1 methyltransferase domain-containing protein [Puniceicoccus vermicola]